MCLLLIALRSHPKYKLILAANRDEYYDRPTARVSFWQDAPWVLAGRDLRAGGTWLGVTKTGRISAITNYRDAATLKAPAPTRGKLVSDFLLGKEKPKTYLERLAYVAHRFDGFNLVVGEKEDLYWYSNRGGQGIQKILPGIHGLSNHLLDTPWPKVNRGKAALAQLLSRSRDLSPEQLFFLLGDRHIPSDENLPDTGVGLQWERILSPIFITSPTYGSRSSTLVFTDLADRVTFIERTLDPNSEDGTAVTYTFQIN